MLAWVLERWVNWSDNGGDVETVFTKDDLCNNNRYPWTPSHDRRPPIEAPTGITFVGYENPPGVRTDQRVQHLLESDAPAGTTTSTSPPMITAATSSPGRSPTSGSTTSGEPSAAAAKGG